jgi:oligopeptide/dipeptide ABC transporter ATP-binding protein
MAPPLLEIAGLTVAFRTEAGLREVLSDVSLTVQPGEIVGIVGESGSGKSVTALAVMRLLGEQGSVRAGRIALDGRELTTLDATAMRAVRGRDIAMIFQEPMTSLNPLLRVGFQIEETLRAHRGLAGRHARARGVRLLDEVGIPEAAARYDLYPHLLSGGMRQRVMIAIAMACEPRLLIADEPTTALDVTIQAQILALMQRLRAERGSSILLITHDMGVIAHSADVVAVMYAGQIVETAPVRDILTRPAHPYTSLLLAGVPSTRRRLRRLPVIPGQLPPPGSITTGCRFLPRCPIAVARCGTDAPALRQSAANRSVRCWRAGEAVVAVDG